ncbi:hypothetical protein BABINDRAFT_161083 [Babjeviella inositovora NRRL Y-12698]|uniref:PRELI/MSF1 domain-containing protein n=1 Tax=Babjeviella inositovora NRRL Y-12698 TaxID=984486 RepID=A0A1E3QR15_9ASCO|nr:uncharacterized protein BABINDRAFT_161083 [Babjeviella inositovora NRRL Y-12698]ODQ80090.1 hypothetical protein BABINDRAFT_161083 [Babjeviella inositovora NRRL Y-12698]
MKLYSSEHHFDYPWTTITAANWQKYPNEMSSHVIGVDVLRREVYPETKILRTERLITCKQPVPKWLSMLTGGDNISYVREVSEVDLVNRTLTLRSNNMTMNHLLSVYEVVVYRPDPEDPNRTIFKQEAEITAYASFRRLCDKIEDFSVERFGQNALKGKIGFEGVLHYLDSEWIENRYLKHVRKELNVVTQEATEIVSDVTKKTSVILSEVNELTSEVISEVAGKTSGAIQEVSEKTSSVLSEVTDITSKTNSVLYQVTRLVKGGIFRGSND